MKSYRALVQAVIEERMQASMRGFAMRLKHMGFDAYVVFDTTTPASSSGRNRRESASA